MGDYITNIDYPDAEEIDRQTKEPIKKLSAAYEKRQDCASPNDNWKELRELIQNFDGTPMEKLAAIERFVESHS